MGLGDALLGPRVDVVHRLEQQLERWRLGQHHVNAARLALMSALGEPDDRSIGCTFAHSRHEVIRVDPQHLTIDEDHEGRVRAEQLEPLSPAASSA